MITMENAKEEHKILKFTNGVLFVTILALILVSGTYSKYTSSASGTSIATVAKWDIKAGIAGEEVSITGEDATVAFNLFDTILEEDGVTEELDVYAEDGKVVRIAPGTSGAFDLSVLNNSEVTAAYTIEFTVDRTDIPLQFNVNNAGWTTTLDNVTETVIAMGSSSTANVQWKWAFEGGNDATDTALGIEAPEIIVTATLNVVQYDASEGAGSTDEEPKTLQLGNLFSEDTSDDTSNEFGTVLQNQYYLAGFQIALPSDSDIDSILVYRQDSETQTYPAELYGQGSNVAIDEEGYYGIVLWKEDGMAGYETSDIGDLVQKVN